MSSSSNCADKIANATDNELVRAWLHVPGTIFTLLVFIFAIQQFLGAPTSHQKVFRYRTTGAIACGTALIIAICLNFELERYAGNELVGANFVYFVLTLMIVWVFIALIEGYWFVNDAVGAAYKALKGINQVEPPKWISKFWFVVICLEQTMLVICYIFAFADQNAYFLNLLYLSSFAVGVLGAIIVMGCVFTVGRHINAAIRGQAPQIQENQPTDPNPRTSQKQVLENARRTLIIMALAGTAFFICCIAAFIVVTIAVVARPYCSGASNLNSTVLDSPFDYIRYLLTINGFNLSLIFWTYRSSNINYCCFCWQYKKYTTDEWREREIDSSVVCYYCFPAMIDEADEKRTAIIEDSTMMESDANTSNKNTNPNGGQTNNVR